MNTPSFCDASSAVAITRYTKPTSSWALFLAAVAVALLLYAVIVDGGVYVPI